jgi:ribonucleoside-diphosphate reductase alpha chain
VYAPNGPRFRNATRTCIAPTGTIAIIAGASSGIEPLFSLAHVRRMGDGTVLPEVNDAFRDTARAAAFLPEPELEALFDDLAHGALLAERPDVPQPLRDRFATAHEITPIWHVRMQAAFQAHTDLAVSKTVNLPRTATVTDVHDVYTLAHQLGCKGVTVYRDGSRAVQVLAHTLAQDAAASGSAVEPYRRHLPDERSSVTHKFRVGEQEGYITAGLFEDGTVGEVFIKIAKEGSTVSGLTDAVALLTSIALQYGVGLDRLAAKLEQTRFEPYGVTANPQIPFATSILDYVYRWLRLHFATDGADAAGVTPADAATVASGVTCPDCGQQLHYIERCLTCEACGYTRCG